MTAAPGLIPPPLIHQLKAGGKMVVPAGLPDPQQLVLVEKHSNGRVTTRKIYRCGSRNSRMPNRADDFQPECSPTRALMAIGKQTLRSLITVHDHDLDHLRRGGVELDQARTPPISTSTRQSPGPRVLLSWCRVAPASSVTDALTTYLAQSLGSASRQARNQQQTNTARSVGRPRRQIQRFGRGAQNVFEGKDVNIEAIRTPIGTSMTAGLSSARLVSS